MQDSPTIVAPYILYGILFVIGVNFFVSFFLTYFSKIKGLKLVFYYWTSLFAAYLFQGLLTGSNQQIIIGFGASFIPCLINSKILLDSLKKETPYLKFVKIYILGLVTSIVLSFFDLSFTTQALPLTIVVALPLVLPSLQVLFQKRKNTTPLQKFISVQYLLAAVHAINFALFRMEEGSQVLGFGSALLLYQTMSVSLLAFSIEESSKKEKERLQEQVDERTKDLTLSNSNLQNALSVKEVLLKVVLHDIANPVAAQSMLLQTVNEINHKSVLEKIGSLTNVVLSIIKKVRTLSPVADGIDGIELQAVGLKKCFETTSLIFKEPLEKKNIVLKYETSLQEDTCFLAEETTFTTSVLNNLISNAIKFSHHDSKIFIRSFEKDNRIIIEIEDFGIGMNETTLHDLFNPLTVKSTQGTDGETGTGYGLSLVKFYVNHFRGFVQVESRSQNEFPQNHGTKFSLNLQKT